MARPTKRSRKVTPMISGEGTAFRLIRCEDNAGWLDQRKKGIGGSDVAAIMGLSPWRTPAEVWLEKTSRAEPQDLSDRPHVQRGVDLESYVGTKFKESHRGFRTKRVNAICQSIERPWAQASLDYEVAEPNSQILRNKGGKFQQGIDWGVLEIKTSRNDADWKDGIPAYYLTQVMHYLSVTGREFAWVAVQFDSDWLWEYREYRIERDEEDIAAINAAVDTFWHEFVEADVMPVLVGTAGEAQGLTQMFATPTVESFTTTDADTLQLVSDYQDASEREKQAKADKQTASTLLMAKIGEHKQMFTDTAKVTWSRSEQERFDTKRFKADHPDLYAQYVSTYTRNGGLRVTDLKK